jgi:hypothetical protein
MRYRNPLFGILSVVAAGLLLNIFKETGWAIFVERFLEESAHSLGIERAAMIATLFQVLVAGGILWAALYFAFRVGKAERPDPAVEAQHRHTEAILAQTEVMKFSARPLVEVMPARDKSAIESNWTRDVSLLEALWRAFSGKWSGQRRVTESHEILRFEIAADDIRQHAFEGQLPVWARRPHSDLYEPLPRDFWRNHAIETGYSLNATERDVWVYVTQAISLGDFPNARTTAWEGFMTSREAIEKLWPANP